MDQQLDAGWKEQTVGGEKSWLLYQTSTFYVYMLADINIVRII